jgi:hypothetical protein
MASQNKEVFVKVLLNRMVYLLKLSTKGVNPTAASKRITTLVRV